MLNYKPMAVMLVVMASLILVSCSDDDDSPENTPQGFNPAGMVLIHAGNQSFQMGSADGLADEQPIHTVQLSHDFWIDTVEVTQADYDSLMNRYYAGYDQPSWHEPYGVGTGYPAYSVYWGDAALYCNARSKRDGLDTVYTYTTID